MKVFIAYNEEFKNEVLTYINNFVFENRQGENYITTNAVNFNSAVDNIRYWALIDGINNAFCGTNEEIENKTTQLLNDLTNWDILRGQLTEITNLLDEELTNE